ncbi:BBP7 family outer membrane beta-barrel protein [Botrimarina sp.]|uniref:BBP7 family outer membrane beta-barrel protein n=1 Tax=Botrimarina sp. TaxID=2795802 RepID=UPI0032ED17B6
MSASRICLLAPAALALVMTPSARCLAQAYGAHSVVEHNDLRWFEPTMIDLDGQANHRQKGWTASIEKLGWSITGERITIGNPGVVNESEEIYPDNPDAAVQAYVTELAVALQFDPARPDADDILSQISELTGAELTTETFEVIVGEDDEAFAVTVPIIVPGTGFQVPPTYLVQNGIQDAAPDADFGFGERYEIGYTDGERGWRIGILDGPELSQRLVYGAGLGNEYTSQSLDDFANTHPFYGSAPFDLDQDGQLDAIGPLGELYALGFGSVAINFQAPERYFEGFRDYVINGFPVGTVYGPINSVNNAGGPVDEPLEGGEAVEVEQAPDDFNGNGRQFTIYVADLDGDGEIDDDEIVFTYIDYGDLYEFDLFFEEVVVRNVTRVDGIELMLTHQIDTGHKLERGRRDQLELSYGLRYLELRDSFQVTGFGSVIRGFDVFAEMDNQLIGPQIGLNWTRDHGAWEWSVSGRAMLAYNRTDRGLNGIFAQGAVPGSLNTPVHARATTTVLGEALDEFSPLAELRVEARYNLTSAISLNLGYTGTFIDNIQRASQSVVWTAPNFAMQDGRSHILMNGVNGGVEFRY